MRIVGISGRKQAGKSTAANVLHGLVLEKYGLVENWTIGDNGGLVVLTTNATGKKGWGEFDVSRKDKGFTDYAEHNMWPYVKLYSFADSLKWMCTDLFDIPYRCVWGTDEQKNQLQEHLLWENMPGVMTSENWSILEGRLNPDIISRPEEFQYVVGEGQMTAREFMQFLGTDIMRKMYEPIWVNATIKKIQREQPELAVIADVRFPNEANAIADAGGYITRLTRKPLSEDVHSSETALDDYSFNYVIDNEDEALTVFIGRVRDFYSRHLEEVTFAPVA